MYYDKDWKPLDQETFAALQRDLVTAASWIIDGNYVSTLPLRRRYLTEPARSSSGLCYRGSPPVT
jgi:hypothetical protein